MIGNDADTAGTDTMEHILKNNILQTKAITYGNMVCDYCQLKVEPNRCRLVVGGDKLTHKNETAAPAANLIETKIMLNSVISTKGAKFLTIDIKDFSYHP